MSRDIALRDESANAALEEMRRVLEVPFDAQDTVGQDGCRYAERGFPCARRLLRRLRIGNVRVAGELRADEGNDEEIGLRVRAHWNQPRDNRDRRDEPRLARPNPKGEGG